MQTQLLYAFWALAAGCMIAAQSLINARLALYVGGPVWAAFTSFLVGTILIFALGFLLKGKLPDLQIDNIQWWMLLGGVLGAGFVITSISVVPHLGVTAMIALFIAGQLTAAMLLDHFGVLSAFARPITLQKTFGICLLIAGAFIILKSKSA